MPSLSDMPHVTVANEPLYKTLLDAIWSHASNDSNKIAFINADNNSVHVTYRSLYLYAQSICAFLETRHFRRGDIACVVLPNCWHYAAFFLGASMNGGAISGASCHFTDYELEQQFSDSKCKVVLTSEENLQKVLKAARNCPLITTMIVIPENEETVKDDRHRFSWGIIEWTTIVAEQPNMHKAQFDQNTATDVAILPYSSGTTGSPKGVMLSHRNFGTMLAVLNSQLDNVLMPKLDPNWCWTNNTILHFLPFYHIYGFGILCMSLMKGTTGIVFHHFDAHLFCRNIQEHKVRVLMVVPPILVFLAKSPIVSNYDLSSVIFALSGAAPAGKDLCDEVLLRHKNIRSILQGYGMTEMGMASHLPDLNDDQKFGNCGRLAATYEQKIVDLKTGKECPIGVSGEICVRGPTVMIGYLNKPQSTAEAIDDEGWLHSGDIGYLDERGYLFIIDRLKELIKVRGFQVPPAELEDILLSHPYIRDAAVIGIPDKTAGELPRAYVVRANDTLMEKDVFQYVKDKVSHYKQLKGGIRFVNEIPKSASGKILRRLLRDEAIAEIQHSSKL